MGDILLNSKVIIYLLSEGITYLMLFIAFIVAVEGVIKWNYSSYSEEQYQIREESIPIVTITLFASILNFLFFHILFLVIDISRSYGSRLPNCCGAWVLTFGVPKLG